MHIAVLPGDGIGSEIMAEAEESTVNEFERWCRQGPSGSRVKDVIVAGAQPGDHHEFRIIG